MKSHDDDKGKAVHGTIEAAGSGRLEVAPDEAVVQLSIVTEAKSASEAVTANAAATQAVIDAVAAQPNHGVTTSGLGVGPLTQYDPQTLITAIVGYRATNGVSVKTKVGYAGQVFDAGIAAGANQSSGIDFRLQQDGPVREQALRLAVEDAFAQARVVAQAAGVEVLGVETIAIDSGGGRFLLRAAALDAGSPRTPVLPGDLTISAGVRLVLRTRG